MNKVTVTATALRMLLGWLMFFAGIEKVLNPEWTAQGFLLGAKTFPGFYAWFALPMNTWWVDPLNAWGITLVGVALLLGIAVRPAAWAGVMLMALYYFPQYVFPIVPHGYIVDDHVIYAAVFVFISVFAPAQHVGLGKMLRGTFLGRLPVIGPML